MAVAPPPPRRAAVEVAELLVELSADFMKQFPGEVGAAADLKMIKDQAFLPSGELAPSLTLRPSLRPRPSLHRACAEPDSSPKPARARACAELDSSPPSCATGALDVCLQRGPGHRTCMLEVF